MWYGKPMLRLESIKIQRFRGIREGEVAGLVDVNILIGRNNCGKSTIAEAICRLGSGLEFKSADPLNRSLSEVWQHARGEPANRVPAELWYRRERDKTALIQGYIPNVDVATKFHPTGSVKSVARSLTRNHPVAQFLKLLTLFLPSDATNQKIELQLWQQLLKDRIDKRTTHALNDIFGLDAEGLQLPPDGRMTLLLPDLALSVDVYGDGTRAAVRCLLMLAALEKTLFILEEPESHQHPGSLERFATALCKMAKTQEVQLLITTHSIESVRAFLKAAGTAGSESAVFHLTLDDGLLDSRRLDPDTVEKLLETGVDVRCLDLYG